MALSQRGLFFMSNQFRDFENRKPNRSSTNWGSTNHVFRTALTIEIGLGFIALLLGWITGIDVRRWLPRFETDYAYSIALSIAGGFVCTFPMIIGIDLLLRIKLRAIQEINQLEASADIKPLLELRTIEIVTLSIAAGVGEELLLRGWLMGWLLDIDAPIAFGQSVIPLIVSSLAFGLMHPITPLYMALTGLLGFYLGAVTIWTEDLLLAMVAHASYDAIQLIQVQKRKTK